MTVSAGAPLRRTLRSAQRIRILDALRSESPLPLSRLSERARLRPNTARDHLAILLRTGLVTARDERRTGRGRPRKLYSLAAGLDDASPATRGRTRRAVELGDIYRRAYARSASAPTLPVRAANQLDVLEDHLDRCGFQPQRDDSGLRVDLTCPLSDLMDDLPRTVCSVDLRLVQSVLARVDGPLRATAILPVVPRESCVLQLRLRDAANA